MLDGLTGGGAGCCNISVYFFGFGCAVQYYKSKILLLETAVGSIVWTVSAHNNVYLQYWTKAQIHCQGNGRFSFHNIE